MILAIVLAATFFATLATLDMIGQSRGVSRVPIPSGSLVERQAADADYSDSYAAAVPARLFPDTRALDRFAFQKATAVGRTTDEIMYRGGSSWLVYHISYLRRGGADDAKLFVSTTVHYRSWQGRLYFAFVRPAHRVLTPFMVSVMIRQASAAS